MGQFDFTTGKTPIKLSDHSTRHENGGDDEISVEGLSGDLADLQDPKDHDHSSAGSGVGGIIPATSVEVSELGAATYDDVQDYINFFGDRTLLSGGTITDNGNGTAAIASLTGWCKVTDDEDAVGKFFNWASPGNTPSLTDMTTNYVYLDYNGGTLQLVVATSIQTFGHKLDHILIGTIFRDGSTLHWHQHHNIGIQRANVVDFHHLEESAAHVASGLVTSNTGLSLSITSGVIYEGLDRQPTTVDGSIWSTWHYNFNTSAWVETINQNTIDNLQYNPTGSGTGLVTLTANRYAVHWVYVDIDGVHLHIVYGQGDYKANEAEEASVPSLLPNQVTNYGVLIAKIIVQKSQTALIILYPWTTVFTSSLATDHDSLANVGSSTSHSNYILHSLATAASDFLVASGAGVFIKKTLAEVKTLLGIVGDIATHAALSVAGTHGSTTAATADKLVHRDAAGRAKVVAPGVAGDVALKSTVTADILTHKNIATAHHTKYTDGDAVTAMGAKADGNPLNHDRAEEWGATEHTAIGNGAPHHTKYLDSAALAAAEAGAVSAATANKLVKRDASARAKFAQSAAAGDAIVADANNRAPDSTLLEGSSKATVQDHTPKAHTLASHSTKAHSELSDAPEGAHHTKFTTTEHSSIGNSAPHHTKYTDANARTAAVEDATYGAGWNNDTTHAPSQNAVYDKIQTLGGGATLTVPSGTGTEVFSGTSPTSWTDLNLSGTIGSNVALILLKFAFTTSALKYVSVRKNGDTDEFYSTYGAFPGCAFIEGSNQAHRVMCVAADATGKIEWKAEIALACTLDIIAYIK